MDQEPFVSVDSLDSDVRLDEAPQSAEHYLRQVMLDRSQQAEVVKVELDTNRFHGRQTLVVKQEDVCSTAAGLSAPEAWQEQQMADFSDLRHKLSVRKARMKKDKTLPIYKFPDQLNEAGWKSFCYRKFSNQLDVGESELKENDRLKVHQGTPPLLRLMLAMTQLQVVDCLTFQAQWFVSEGYSAARMHWLFALLALLEKPIDPDVCASLRDVARHCVQLRATLEKEDPLVRQFSWFICIVARYFDQRDLADK